MSLAIMEYLVSTFYDFLIDPARSGFFCVTTPVNHLISPLVPAQGTELRIGSSRATALLHTLIRKVIVFIGSSSNGWYQPVVSPSI